MDQKVKMYFLDVETEAREYLKIKLPFFLWYPLSKSSIFRVFSKLIPGFYELIILGKMWYDFYTNKYDFYVFDALPTGQILSMLKIPEAGLKSGAGGLVKSDFEKMYEFVKNVKIVLVSLPEHVVHDESGEFVKSAREYNLNFDTVFLNKFYYNNLDEKDLKWLETMLVEGKLTRKEKKEIKAILSFERFFASNSQMFYNSFLSFGLNVLKIPFSFSEMNKEFFEQGFSLFKNFL